MVELVGVDMMPEKGGVEIDIVDEDISIDVAYIAEWK